MSKLNLIFCICICIGMINAQKYNLAPSKLITDEYFGIKIVDEYRNLENLNDPSTMNWMKDQTKYSLSILQNIPNRQYYIDKRLEFDKRKSFSVSNINITENDFYFYLKQKPQENTARVFLRKGFNGIEKEIFNPQNYNPENKKKYQINYIKPNYDGSKIAIALTESGKEISEMIIYDLIQDKLLPYIITNCWPADSGGISWLPDNNSFIYLYYPVIDPNSALFLRNMESVLYRIGDNPKKLNVLLSKKNNPELKIKSEDFPRVKLLSKDSKYLFGYASGSTKFKDTYYMNIKNINKKKQWNFLFSKEDKITDFIIIDNTIIYISEKNGTNAIYSTSLENPNFKNPNIVIPNIRNEVINAVYKIRDGFVFNTSKNGVESKLYLYKNKKSELLILPFLAGDVSVLTQDNYSNDFWISCSGWKNETEWFKYNSLTGKFAAENLAPVIEYPELKDVVVEEITVKSYDGLDIPLSLIYNKNIKKNKSNPLLVDAYGAYAYKNSPYFAKTYMLWALQGGIVAIAHVRGGGEKGEEWYKGGYKTTKPNSWKDLISCAEYMIKENYTSSEKIAIWGASAGGITIGRAMTERPDLFKVAIIDAGIVNSSRMEFTPNGLNSAKEFGSLGIESEFKALLEMDAYQHLKKGEKYPTTLVTSGINDPRVPPWMPTKFAAKLLAYNISENPNLLKIDYEGGHGGDIPVAQIYDNLADAFAFAFWQLGHPDYQPQESLK
ncbi:prolyl oligopeptidase [Chryseobacterium piperi]|uniref:prolyl oligopeptidase n=1 Tax=Chryseobacterium piperi TaxID=558152 RepID=A0A086B4I8_9FLAO|nr:prolyl oligopeptidase family serine peptidase [Chryseobacterium piperi]ASW73124.1 prolyl oligopeptidase [Chryseobacterium piperi]KFF23852.1 prolyl oligopeptidase [Chryseobacterium piperi]